jgi:hypothetical protein
MQPSIANTLNNEINDETIKQNSYSVINDKNGSFISNNQGKFTNNNNGKVANNEKQKNEINGHVNALAQIIVQSM